jgi:hypothetical protein
MTDVDSLPIDDQRILRCYSSYGLTEIVVFLNTMMKEQEGRNLEQQNRNTDQSNLGYTRESNTDTRQDKSWKMQNRLKH